MEIILAQPRGFCAGVERAVKVVENALEIYHYKTIYVLHEIVHNQHIISNFQKKGVRFVESIDDIPDLDVIVILSAHGTSNSVLYYAKKRFEIVIDATCPLVTKVHKEIKRNWSKGQENILIGHKGHQEVIGTMGQINQEVKLVQSIQDVAELQVKDPENLSYVTQTTLSVDDTREIVKALEDKFPNIQGPNLKDVCYATQNRQNAVKELAKIADIIFIIGSQNSSNSARLLEVAQSCLVPAYLIDNYTDINICWLDGAKKVGITAGASAPEILVQDTVNFLRSKFITATVSTISLIQENVRFQLPKMS